MTEDYQSLKGLEIYPASTWEILDHDTAHLVAVFYDEQAARDYLQWRRGVSTEKENGPDTSET
jgi:hypothetical protein